MQRESASHNPVCFQLSDPRDLRQVPDTQEVFLYPDCGISMIVEVLECVEAQDTQGIAK